MLKRLFLLLAGLAMLVPAVHAQDLPDAALQTATRTVEQLVPGVGIRDSWEFEILFPSTDSALNCLIVPGYKTDTERQPYVVNLTYSGEVYRVHVAGDGSVAVPCDLKFGATNRGMSALSTELPPAADACQVTPSDDFANLRTQPNVDAEQVGTLEQTEQVLGRDADTTWYLTQNGWVAGTVVNTRGDCSPNVVAERDVNIIPMGDTEAVPGAPAPGTPVTQATLPAGVTATPRPDFSCPPDFEGYLPPRIQSGPVTAQVEQGGIPNVIRDLPTTDGERRGQIQPGRRLDFVYGRPQCSDGYVWWEVEIDGVRGWTAESSADDETYFLRPIGGNAVNTDTGNVTTAAAPTEIIRPGTFADVRPAGNVDRPDARGFYWNENRLLFWFEGGIQDQNETDAGNELLEQSGLTDVTAVSVLPETAIYVVGDASGNLIVGQDSPTVINAHNSPVNSIAFNADGTRMVTSSGTMNTPAETWTLNLWDAAQLQANPAAPDALLRTIRFPYPVQDAVFSADGESLAVVAERTGDDPAAALWVYDEGGSGANVFTVALDDTEGVAFVTATPTDTVAGDFVYAKGNTLYSLAVETGTERELLTTDDTPIADAAINPAIDSGPQALVVITTSVDAPVLAYAVVDGMVSDAPPSILDTRGGRKIDFSADGGRLALQDDVGIHQYAVE